MGHAIEIYTLAAESNWNSVTLMAAYHQGLSEELNEELAPIDASLSLAHHALSPAALTFLCPL